MTPEPTTATKGLERAATSDTLPALPLRVAIEDVKPQVDGGRFPIKRTVGEEVVVEADLIADGHDRLGGLLLYRREGEPNWRSAPMGLVDNDRWSAAFRVTELGTWEYTVRAWIDRFATWRRKLRKKHEAGQEIDSEILEGAELLEAAAKRAGEPDATWLRGRAGSLRGPGPVANRIGVALDEDVARAASKYPDRDLETAFDRILRVTVERERARCGAWYEMFPRSTGTDPSRSASFRDAESRLPVIAAMGFDVLYLPPIHPIGKTARKGPNNTLPAAPEDPGSPWAIGSQFGGHTAVHPDLGTLEDFDKFHSVARRLGLEVALDIAFQCSPDHPWAREHPEWFRRRPDGSIQYAENPPKKYQDIYPLDYECADWRPLWEACLEVVLFWVRRGVLIFRVDNPHTKPFRFWEWLIRETRARHPAVVFLSEAFTRPKVLRHLAKAGFSQSYSYFTWRNTKAELTEYFTALYQTEVREVLRPNLFANTPDILHEYLQFGGRPGFQIRLVLAATLGANYGIYGPPFEYCVGEAIPGTEEYRDSEKYQVRAWERDPAGHLREFITRVNAIRRDNPALQSDWGLRFHPADSDHVLFFEKSTPDGANTVLVAVNLDPHHAQETWVHLPLEELGLPEDRPYQVHDLLSEARYLWQGPTNFIRLDPASCPAHVFRLRRRVHTEQDFDYYL